MGSQHSWDSRFRYCEQCEQFVELTASHPYQHEGSEPQRVWWKRYNATQIFFAAGACTLAFFIAAFTLLGLIATKPPEVAASSIITQDAGALSLFELARENVEVDNLECVESPTHEISVVGIITSDSPVASLTLVPNLLDGMGQPVLDNYWCFLLLCNFSPASRMVEPLVARTAVPFSISLPQSPTAEECEITLYDTSIVNSGRPTSLPVQALEQIPVFGVFTTALQH